MKIKVNRNVSAGKPPNGTDVWAIGIGAIVLALFTFWMGLFIGDVYL